MSFLGSLRSLSTGIFRLSQISVETDEELRSHIEHRADDLECSGLNRADAERRARIELGSREHYREESYRALGGSWFGTTLQDVRIAWRMLRKSPGFTVVAIITLAFAIGANAVVFSILNALVLRSVNVPDGARIYQIEQAQDHIPSQSYADYVDLRDRNKSFDGLTLYAIDKAGLDANGTPVPAWIYETSSNYFDALKIEPYLGRFFHASDEHGINSVPYLVLSYAYWQTHFHGDPGVVGHVVRVNNTTCTILGVASKDFRGTEVFYAPDFWMPIVNLESADTLKGRGNRGFWIVGRLKPGVTPVQATEDLNAIAAQLKKIYPGDDDGLTFALARPGLLGNMLGSPVHAFVMGLMLLSGLILLAACANLGSLFSARAADRGREVSLRLALGSSRGRILRQLLTEAIMVSLGGAVAGIAGAIMLLRAIGVWQPIPDIPINVPLAADGSTYAVALLLALFSGLLFGLVPVRQVMKANPYQGIKSAVGVTPGMGRFTLRDLLLAVQIALCAVLVTSSLVAVRGMVRSLHSNFGFDPRSAIQLNTDLGMSGYKGDRVPVMQRKLLDAIKDVPGVTSAGFANRIPLNIGWSDSYVYRDSTTDYRSTNRVADATNYAVSPGYFEAAATMVLAGRTFSWTDTKGAPMVAVVNREFARKVFGSESNALGQWFKIWGGTRVQVVGLVEDGKYKTLSEDPQPAMFLSILQSPSEDTWFLVRSDRGQLEIAQDLTRTLNGLDTGLAFVVSTWDRELGTALFAARAASLALGVLGALGAMLAVTGIFGLGAYTVSKRLRELGIRVALGAPKKQVLQAALGRVFRLLVVGSVAGLALGLAATKLLSYIVYQASPRDPIVLVGVVAAMSLFGLLAAWIPAMRALHADPLILLRDE